MLFLLLAIQTPPPQSCATPSLCLLLTEAEAVNRRLMLGSGGYTATIETENATLSQREGRIEGPIRVEQSSARARWATEAGFDYHTIGVQGFSNGIPTSKMSFLRIGWMVPTLSATRLQVITRSGTERTSRDETLSGALAPQIVVHPLAEDRDTFYRFSGGTPERRNIDGYARSVLVIEVIPRGDLTREETLFEGEVDLDPDSKAVVRLVGRFRIVGRPKRSRFRLPDFEPRETLVELINQRLAGGEWVPLVQRFEIKNASSHQAGYASGRRMISRFYEVVPLPALATPGGGIGGTTMGYAMTSAPGDSIRRFRGWRTPLGDATEAPFAEDFLRFRPSKDRPGGKPIIRVQSFERRDFVRFNRIEGLFTGLSAMIRLRDAAPGLFAQATGGYAWAEKTGRGRGALGWESPTWTVMATGGRSLDVTNEFRNQFDSRALSGLIGRDNWDYVDRRYAGISVTRGLDATGGSSVTLELARVQDDSVTPQRSKSLLGRRLRINRGLAEGTYWQARATLDWKPEVSPVYVQDGVGFHAEIERASGDLDYTRVEGRIVARKTLSRLFVLARLHAGALISDFPPPQQLFEIGAPAWLPGYEYKEFAGDHAVLFRMRLTYPIPMLEHPVRISRLFSLPALSPAISVGFQGGITDVRNAAGQNAVNLLGALYDDTTGEPVLDPGTGDPLPAAVVSDKLRKSIDVRIGFFGDALAVGLARALESGRSTQLIIAFGRQF